MPDLNSPASLPNPALTAALEAREVDVSPVPVGEMSAPPTNIAALAPVTPEVPISFTVPPAVTTPLVPGWLALLSGFVAVVGAPAAALLPFPFGAAVASLAILAGVLAGLPSKMPTWMAGRPLVPLCGSLSALLFTFGTSLPEGRVKAGAFLASALLAIAAAKSAPEPMLPAKQ